MQLYSKRYIIFKYCLNIVFLCLWVGGNSHAQKTKKNIQDIIEQGEAEWEVSNYKESIIWFTKAIQADSTNGEVFFKRAKSYILAQEYEKAIRDLTLADSLQYTQLETPFYWGLIYFKQEQFEKSLTFFEQAYQKGYQNDSFYAYLAETYAFLGKNKEANDFFDKALNIYNKDVDLYWLRANFYVKQEEYTKAIADLDKITTLQSHYWKAYQLKADIYFWQNQDSKSLENRLLYFKYLPNKKKITASDYSMIAMNYAASKQFAKSVEYGTKAIELDKDNHEYYFERATYYIQLKNYQKALADCQKAIELDGEDLVYFRQRAFLYKILKKYPEALADYEFLAQQDEKDAENHYYVAEIKYLLKKEPKEFQTDVQTAFQLGYPKEQMRSELQKYAERKLGMARFFKRKTKS
ncbi:MAG: tetratricopeptide repeat protein [Raineya sp.]|jgi:tetratricopeptide (TPR) repeat protein|nr:tetratricopeptide repeat protein [Raineya sp.]